MLACRSNLARIFCSRSLSILTVFQFSCSLFNRRNHPTNRMACNAGGGIRRGVPHCGVVAKSLDAVCAVSKSVYVQTYPNRGSRPCRALG